MHVPCLLLLLLGREYRIIDVLFRRFMFSNAQTIFFCGFHDEVKKSFMIYFIACNGNCTHEHTVHNEREGAVNSWSPTVRCPRTEGVGRSRNESAKS